MSGRFAPSPTGPLHVGNLRTALLAWLVARTEGRGFVVRMEDLDRANSSAAHEAGQLGDLAALGIDWDGPVLRQSDRFGVYDAAIDALAGQGLTYECYCTRREIRDAIAAPHGAPAGGYPGTCRDLPAAQRVDRRRNRPPAIRLRSTGETVTFTDRLAGPCSGAVDDVVLRRNDGVPAYNLAVVVDDAAQRITTVVRGDDLVDSTPRQILLQRLLGLPAVEYAHVPLVVGADGARLAKRHGAVTLADVTATGVTAARMRGALAASLGLAAPGETVSSAELVARFSLDAVAARGREPVAFADLQRLWAVP